MFVYCMPNSADSVMDRMKNTPNVLKMHLKAWVDYVPYSADLATVSNRRFINYFQILDFLKLIKLFTLTDYEFNEGE